MRIAFLKQAGSVFTDRCGCVYSRDLDVEPYVSPCLKHRDTITASSGCQECGWDYAHDGQGGRDEFHLCLIHGTLWQNA